MHPARITSFFFEPEFEREGVIGPCVIVLVGPKWTGFLRRRLGLRVQAFFERGALAHEPSAFASGHPFAWLYGVPEQVLLDEQRWLPPSELERLSLALQCEMASARGTCGSPARAGLRVQATFHPDNTAAA